MMKHIVPAMVLAAFIGIFSGCNANGKNGSFTETFGTEASYALGMDIGTNLKGSEIYPNIKEFVQGMQDVLSGSATRYTIDEAYQLLNETFSALTEERSMANQQAENEFLAENSKKPGIYISASGLQYEVISEGTGPQPTFTDVVRVHYEGTLIDGTVFDSSYFNEEPAELPLNRVISGWAEGLQLMRTGSKYRLFIPSELGYGPQGMGGQIPPYSTLIFEVELLDIIQE